RRRWRRGLGWPRGGRPRASHTGTAPASSCCATRTRPTRWRGGPAALGGRAAGGYPVPRVLGVVVVDGRPGLVLERVAGDDLLTALGRNPLALRRGAPAPGRRPPPPPHPHRPRAPH